MGSNFFADCRMNASHSINPPSIGLISPWRPTCERSPMCRRRVCGRFHVPPLVAASDDSLAGYGCLVDEPKAFPIEIVRWPAQGWRPVDESSGDQGGVTEGLFEFCWKGDTLYARNNAVGDSYLFGWSTWPEEATTSGPGILRERALIWRANYHPDGGQLFYPLNRESLLCLSPCRETTSVRSNS